MTVTRSVGDPLLDIPSIADYAKTSPDMVRRAIKRAESSRDHLPAMKHFGKLKARLSDVDAWIDRTKEFAA